MLLAPQRPFHDRAQQVVGQRPRPGQGGLRTRRLVCSGCSSHCRSTHGNEQKKTAASPDRGQATQTRSHAAVTAGWQLKNPVVAPLITSQLEPAEAIQQSLDFIHPSQSTRLLRRTWLKSCARLRLTMELWSRSANSQSNSGACLLCAVCSEPLQPVELDSFFHAQLWREMLTASRCSDVSLNDQIMPGMLIVGDIAASNRWQPDRKEHASALTVGQLEQRA